MVSCIFIVCVEGVARSASIWGPYEKLGVPLLSTGIVGSSNGQKLIGPGHASYLQDVSSGEWYSVWHASVGSSCNRLPYVSRVAFGADDGWPYVDW